MNTIVTEYCGEFVYPDNISPLRRTHMARVPGQVIVIDGINVCETLERLNKKKWIPLNQYANGLGCLLNSASKKEAICKMV